MTNMEQLFLLEVLVDTLYFQSVAMVPQKRQIIIAATFGNLVTLEIRTDTLGALEHTSENKRKDIEINFGKSYLFFAKPDDLLNALEKCPLEITISTKASPIPIANATVNWESDFGYMLSSCNDNVGYMTPAFQASFYEMRHKDLVIGDVDLFVRLSCFGKNISTNLQIVKPPKDGPPASTKFLFKSANAATTYECQIYGMGTSQEFLPIAPMYQTVDVHTQLYGMKAYERQRSTETINSESRVPSVFVMDMPVRDFNPIDLKNLADLLTGHRESMIVRPDEMQFTNLEQLMEVQQEQSSEEDYKFGETSSSSPDLTDLTIEKIEKQLCQHKDCPAAKMFKEYGIGPLATGKGLGTVYNKNDVKVPTTYGITQTFGHADHYGPFGLYSRPKRPDQPFIPRDSHSSMKKSISDSNGKCKKCCKNSCNKLKGGEVKDILIRLRGGGINPTKKYLLKSFKEMPLQNKSTIISFETECVVCHLNVLEQNFVEEVPEYIIEDLDNCNVDIEKAKFCRYMSKMVRLRGGGKCDEDQEDNSPMSKCRELMQEFDRVVSAYKKALGPCGKAICPFAQNVVIENCRRQCPGSRPQSGALSTPTTSKTDDTSDSATLTSCPGPEDGMSACGNDTCEYRRHEECPVAAEFKKSQLKSACGAPSCPYVKQRLGCEDEDDDGGIKLHDLPRNCGGSKCPFIAMDPLPPIHWDCPDPLPKGGICKNRDCPIVRKQHVIDCSFTAPKPPCGQGTCPYAPPPPCDFEGCPFGPLIDPCPSFCPYKRDPCPTKCPYAVEEPNQCADPTCPYNLAAAQNSQHSCSQNTPNANGDATECFHGPGGHSPDEPCPNPDCPYNTGGGFDADDEDDEITSCYKDTCKAASGGPHECDHCVASGGVKGTCDCAKGRGQGDRSNEKDKKQQQRGSKSGVQQVFTQRGSHKRRSSRDVEPPMEKKDMNLGQNQNENRNPNPGSADHRQSQQPTYDNNPPSQQQPTNQYSNTQQTHQEHPGTPITVAPSGSAGIAHHKRKHKHRSQFVYGEGDMYPGIHVGHKFCNTPTMNVPKNMGWLWNIKSHVGRLKPRRGWRPGAICKTIAARIEEHRRQLGILAPASQKPNKRRKKKDGTYGGYESESEEELAPKPTLQIKKKDGCYWITMNPLKDPATLEENENPYMDCTPMQFKIAKGGTEEEKEVPVKTCFCGDDEDTTVVGGAPPEASDSELDIEFTPPAGIIHPERHRRKKNIVHIDTQYDTKDFLPPNLQLEAKDGKGKGKGKKGEKGGKGGKGGKGAKGGKGGKGGKRGKVVKV